MFWGYSLKFRPEQNRPNIYGIGTSNESDPEMAIEIFMASSFHC